jgi:P-type conjugative transfer protein TrbJ
MTMFTRNISTKKIALLLVLVSPGIQHQAKAAVPVIDASNLSQNVVTAVENVAHTLKQIEQYKTQLQQYENMIQNTAAPAAYIWDKATTTMGQLRGAIDTMNHYKASLGSIDAYLGKFKDTAAYRNSPCFSIAGCMPAQWSALKKSQRLGSEAQKKATDALFRGLDQQQNAMESDARQLERLQSSAQGATGQMQAIGFANQLASQQANQLLQIRALLIAQQNAIATRNQALADDEARQQAAHEASADIRGPNTMPSALAKW